MEHHTYLFASSKPWNVARFAERRDALPGRWLCVGAAADLTIELVTALRPRYVFFPHWSTRVPQAILEATECVCFHMTDVPYGRGGSPLQNLIQRGHRDTVLTALRMESEMDAGPVYAKRPLDLSGSAADIFARAADIILDLVELIVRDEPKPVPQTGEPTHFRRRRPMESVIPDTGDLDAIYDHIRMLDADTYPHAFIDHGPWRLTFRDAQRAAGSLTAAATFRKREDFEA